MAIIVLGIGAIMVLAGAGEIYYGSGYIEIERGWSAFIAGTILLTGGLLTLALGLALRSLGEMKIVLLQLGGLSALPAPDSALPQYAMPTRDVSAVLHPHEPAMALDGPALQIEPHFGLTPTVAEATAAPFVLRDEVEPPLPTAPAPPADHRAEAVERHGSDVLHDDSLRDGATHGEYLRDAGEPGGPSHEWSDLDDAREAAQPHAPEPPAEPSQPEHAGHEHASHEHAGQEYDGQGYTDHEPPVASGAILGEAPAPEPPAPTAKRLAEALVPSRVLADPNAAEPVAVKPSPAPQPAPSSPAVIGRYESDGTSYVMYADGAIEAQSEAGIYRFASMAELKAFIET